jgi:hypothetical protein
VLTLKQAGKNADTVWLAEKTGYQLSDTSTDAGMEEEQPPGKTGMNEGPRPETGVKLPVAEPCPGDISTKDSKSSLE